MLASAEEKTDKPAEEGEHAPAQITRRAGIVGAGTLVSRVLGLGRDQVLAFAFTVSQTDAFWIAFTIPNLLRQLVAEGAVQSAVIPVLAQVREKEGEARAKSFFQAIRGLSTLVLLVLTALGMFFAPQLVELFATGFKHSPEQFERTVTLTRWLFPYLLTIGTVALGVAALNTYRRFVVSSFAPALLNVAFIACALGLSGVLAIHGYDPILSMALGALLGGVLQMIAQWPSLAAIGYASPPRFALRDPAVREVLRRMGPVCIGLGIYYIDVIIGRRLLSDLGEGPVSYFNFALRLCDFPQGIFVMALQAATLPSLAALVAKKDERGTAESFAYGMRLALFVGLGASAMLVALAHPIVVMLFQRGKFSALQAEQTALALMAQGAGIWMVACVRQLVTVFYATGDTRTPVVVSALDLVSFIAVAMLLKGSFGHVGISIAVSCASLVQMSLLWWQVKRRLPALENRPIALSALKNGSAALLAGVSSWAVSDVLASALGPGAWARLVPGMAGIFVFCAVFFTLLALLKSEEFSALSGPLLRRLKRRRAA